MTAPTKVTHEEHTPQDLRRMAAGMKDAGHAHRVQVISSLLDGSARSRAAEFAGVDRQTLRDWVERYNEVGVDGLATFSSPGRQCLLTPRQDEELPGIAEKGPDLDKDGVVRWRRVDLIQQSVARFGVPAVTDRHAALDYAQILKDLSDRHFPGANKIVLVQDNLSTHKPASLHEAFPAAEARRLIERSEWHCTPKHGSWLDMAESELSVLCGQCLDRRIPDKQTLIEEVTAWQEHRNNNHVKADGQFTTTDARIKLKRLYPAL